MRISIIGTGYVGLVTGACLAEVGHDITCIDISKSRVASLKKGKVPFYEPGLDILISKNIKKNRLSFSSSYKTACVNNIFFICVDTPDDGSGEPKLDNFNSVLSLLNKNIKKESYIFIKSTVPIGTNKYAQDFFENESNKNEIHVSSNPEFLREGSAIYDFMNPDRIVIGSSNNKPVKIASEIYKNLVTKKRLLFMSLSSAEITKYAANSFLATKISFINEISEICEISGGNIKEVKQGISYDVRIGKHFLDAGIGWGGSCLPKDVNAIISFQKKFKLKTGIINQAKSVNDRQLKNFFNKIKTFYKGSMSNITLTIWGLSFKPDTDDLRDSVSIKLIRMLSDEVKLMNLYDPISIENARIELSGVSNIKFYKDKYSAFKDSDALIIATDSKEFSNPKVSELKKLKSKMIFDGRNFLDKKSINKSEINYNGVGY